MSIEKERLLDLIVFYNCTLPLCSASIFHNNNVSRSAIKFHNLFRPALNPVPSFCFQHFYKGVKCETLITLTLKNGQNSVINLTFTLSRRVSFCIRHVHAITLMKKIVQKFRETEKTIGNKFLVTGITLYSFFFLLWNGIFHTEILGLFVRACK